MKFKKGQQVGHKKEKERILRAHKHEGNEASQ